jgi:hypothetical protein
LDKGWAMWSWAVANDGWLAFNQFKQQSDGYIRMEVDRLMLELKKALWPKKA